jgi:hypothetical protein
MELSELRIGYGFAADKGLNHEKSFIMVDMLTICEYYG